MTQAIKEMETSNAPGPESVSLVLIADIVDVGMQVMFALCQKVLT